MRTLLFSALAVLNLSLIDGDIEPPSCTEDAESGVSLLQIGWRREAQVIPTDGEDSLALLPKPKGVVLAESGPAIATHLEVRHDGELPGLDLVALEQLFAKSKSIPLKVAQRGHGVAKGLPLYLELRDQHLARNAEEAEQYRLVVSEFEANLTAPSSHGLFNGLMTLRQLAVQDAENKWRLASSEIIDRPAVQWRGMMLDVARHFFPAEEVKDMLSTMALFKFNRFHWHLGDDQGWRIPVQSWPDLTRVGQWRSGTPASPSDNDRHTYDHQLYGGSYTVEDIHDVVKYANSLFIEVVPEIDLPGHVQAALAAYPDLGNTDIPSWKQPSVAHFFGAFDYTLAPKEESFDFMRDVLDEVSNLIPSKYMHLGGDEVSSRQWEDSTNAHLFAQQHGMRNSMSQIQGLFQELGVQHAKELRRRPIVWDEASKPESHLSTEAVVMLWRVFKPEDIASVDDLTRRGYDVILAPHMYTYLDHPEATGGPYPLLEGTVPLKKVYRLPIPESQGTGHVLGGQAQLWTEYIENKAHLDYMAWPRGCALAERLWMGGNAPSFDSFEKRLRPRLLELGDLGVNYRPLAPHSDI